MPRCIACGYRGRSVIRRLLGAAYAYVCRDLERCELRMRGEE